MYIIVIIGINRHIYMHMFVFDLIYLYCVRFISILSVLVLIMLAISVINVDRCRQIGNSV